MYRELNHWIAQSSSWQSYIDFRLPDETISKYNFIERYDDFYISLLSNAYQILESGNIESQKSDLFEIAKGLEIYSLEEKRIHFKGVNSSTNILYTAGLYYLADYSASAILLSKLFSVENYSNEIDVFISNFLRREFSKNKYSNILKKYLQKGSDKFIEKLDLKIEEDLNSAIQSNGQNYLSLLLAKRILEKFKSNNIWFDLLNHETKNFWKRFVRAKISKETPVWDFFPSQRSAILSDLFNTNETVSIQMPTSSGKTTICELIVYNEFQKNKKCKILYLAPFRALASELKQSFGKSLSNLDVKVKTMYGGNIPTQEEKVAIENSNLLISTPEKFMALEESEPLLVEKFTTIICDEGHLIDDSNRGLSYELLLTRLKKDKRVVFISAIIPNIDTINEWLGGKKENIIKSNYRPTILNYAILNENKDGYMLDVNPTDKLPTNYKINKFISNEEFYFFNTKTNRKNKYSRSEKTISSTVALKSIPSGSVALFTAAKGARTGVRGLVNEINKQLNNKLKFPHPIEYADKKHIEKLIDYFTYIFSENYILTISAKNGFLYHTGDLPQFVREIIEDSLRRSKIRLVVCTNTLAEGVNLPIKTIVLHSIKRRFLNSQTKQWETDYINLRDLKNLVGRAGRAGKETKGLIIGTKKSEYNHLKNLIKDIEIEPVKGYLYNLIKNINEQIEEYDITLSNEILDQQSESFLSKLDMIDKSIIHLLNSDIKEKKVEKNIERLLESTLSSFQSNKKENKVLQTLFSLRSQKIKPYINENKFDILKVSGVSIRDFNHFEKLIDFDNEIIKTLENPLDEEWFEYIFDNILFKLPKFSLTLKELDITESKIKKAIVLWLKGKWYGEISVIFDNDIDKSLKIVNQVILYNIQNTIGQIIRLIEFKKADDISEISSQVIKFPQYLLYGTTKESVLDLIEIGFNDRVGYEELAFIIDNQFYYKDLKGLKNILIENENYIIDALRDKIPLLSIENIDKNINTLKYYG